MRRSYLCLVERRQISFWCPCLEEQEIPQWIVTGTGEEERGAKEWFKDIPNASPRLPQKPKPLRAHSGTEESNSIYPDYRHSKKKWKPARFQGLSLDCSRLISFQNNNSSKILLFSIRWMNLSPTLGMLYIKSKIHTRRHLCRCWSIYTQGTEELCAWRFRQGYLWSNGFLTWTFKTILKVTSYLVIWTLGRMSWNK